MSLSARNIVNEPEEPSAKKVWFDETSIHVSLVDGRLISVPLSFYPFLCNIPMDVLQDFELFGEGTAILESWMNIHRKFRELDEYLSIESLVHGRKQIPGLEQFRKGHTPIKSS